MSADAIKRKFLLDRGNFLWMPPNIAVCYLDRKENRCIM
jgi:hypothetical protein